MSYHKNVGVGGGTFDIVSPTFKIVGGRVPPSPGISAHAQL